MRLNILQARRNRYDERGMKISQVKSGSIRESEFQRGRNLQMKEILISSDGIHR